MLTLLGSVVLIWIVLLVHGTGVFAALFSAVLVGLVIAGIMSFSILTARHMVDEARRSKAMPFTADSSTEPSLDEMLSTEAEQGEPKIKLPAWFEQPYPDPDEELGLTGEDLQPVSDSRKVPPDMDQA